MTDSVKIIDVNKIGKPEGGKLNMFESFKENPLSLAKIAGLIIVIGAIIGLLSDSGGGDNTPTVTTVTVDAPPAPIINPKFGTSYSSGGGLDKLYDDLGGNDPLKNGKLDATINVDTDKYSCKFNVKYEGENKKMIECLSGCYNEDENSEFCEGYIYNDQIDGGKRLSDLYDDAGGNENARSGQYNAIINVSSGEDYDTKADTSCGFSVEYVGNNKRSVSCTAGWCDEDDKNYDKCRPYGYESRTEHGTKGDTLLDDTYVNRRGVLEDFTKPSEKQCESNEDCPGNEKCDSNICVVECESNEDCPGNEKCDSNICVECVIESDCPSGNCVDKACKPEGGDNSKNNYFYSLLYVILGIPTLILLSTRDTPMQRSIILFIFGLVCTIIIPAMAFGYNFGKNKVMFWTNIGVIVSIVLLQLLFMFKRIDPLSKWYTLHVLYIAYYVVYGWGINDTFLPFGKKD
jgi:hypothetical protein